VTALVYEIIPRPRAIDPDVADPAEAVMEEIRREAKRTAEAFAVIAAEASVACETIAERSYAYRIGKVFADYVRVRDLAVPGAPLVHRDRRTISAGTAVSSVGCSATKKDSPQSRCGLLD
jgi:hypothetical protein